MVAQSLDLMPHLLADILQKVGRRGIERAGEHEVLPDQQPMFIAEVIEPVRLILSPTPHPDYVHIRGERALEEIFDNLAGLPLRQGIRRNPIRAFAENRHPVDLKQKGSAMGVLFGDELNRPQADTLFHFLARDPHREIVKWLFPIADGPPEPRVGQRDRCLEMIGSEPQLNRN